MTIKGIKKFYLFIYLELTKEYYLYVIEKFLPCVGMSYNLKLML